LAIEKFYRVIVNNKFARYLNSSKVVGRQVILALASYVLPAPLEQVDDGTAIGPGVQVPLAVGHRGQSQEGGHKSNMAMHIF